MTYRYISTNAEFIDDENGFRPAEVKEFTDKTLFIPPYPSIWIMSENGPTIGTEPSGSIFIKPYPPTWIMEDDGPKIGTEPFHIGVFNKCCFCGEVVIPKSVKLIGSHAFANSGVKSVVISQDCTYFDTSFPKDCEIIKV